MPYKLKLPAFSDFSKKQREDLIYQYIKKELESIQRRASLNNPGDRETLLAHPDALELPAISLNPIMCYSFSI